jgi:hypothetical protein
MIAAALAIGLAEMGNQAEAGFVVNVEQVGANVVTNGFDEINLTGLSLSYALRSRRKF